MNYKHLKLSHREKTAFEMFEKHTFYLVANETKTVYFHISLPIVKETIPEIVQNLFRFITLKEV
uniref:hypothetical protein n=1 Tax=Flavobacterium sp. TaxID=239 RepID=UPI00404A731D